MVESGVYGDFLRGGFEYQAHFQNLFKKIKLKLLRLKLSIFESRRSFWSVSLFDQVNFLRSRSKLRPTFLTFANNF